MVHDYAQSKQKGKHINSSIPSDLCKSFDTIVGEKIDITVINRIFKASRLYIENYFP